MPRTSLLGRRAALAVFALSLAGLAPVSARAQELPTGSAPGTPETPSSAPPGSVSPDATPEDDRAIEKRLREIFAAVEGLAGIRVEVTSGVVRISGEVLSSEDVMRAERIARQVRGVVEVQSEVEVVRDVDRRLRPALRSLRARSAELLALLPLVAVALGIVTAFFGLARALTAWERPYQRLVRNAFARDLLRQAVRVLIVGSGIVLALEVLDATTFVAATAGVAGLAGLAFSFAFRDIAENYIASVLLSLRHPFLPHDLVKVAGVEGRVVRLTSRATVLIDLAGNHVRIPNATVFKSVILNYTRDPIRRFDFEVGVAPSTQLGQAIAVGVDTLSRMPGIVAEPPPQAWIERLGDWNVVLRYLAWIDQRESDWFRTRSEGIRVVKEALDCAGIGMPEPGIRVRAGDGADAAPRPETPPAATPELELDISPDPHLDRAVARDRAGGEDDLLDPSAPHE